MLKAAIPREVALVWPVGVFISFLPAVSVPLPPVPAEFPAKVMGVGWSLREKDEVLCRLRMFLLDATKMLQDKVATGKIRKILSLNRRGRGGRGERKGRGGPVSPHLSLRHSRGPENKRSFFVLLSVALFCCEKPAQTAQPLQPAWVSLGPKGWQLLVSAPSLYSPPTPHLC